MDRTELTKTFKDALVFARRFATSPRRIGSITPSSRFLTDALLGKADWESVGAMAELGAGTGVFTRHILRRLKPNSRLMVFELDDALRHQLSRELELDCLADACDLPKLAPPASLDLVVSSLPWTVLPLRVTAAIIDGLLSCLKPDGQLLAYQYSRQMRPIFERRFECVEISFVLRNVPPAFIYNCHRPLQLHR